jgi:enoyl-CoA hydratase/carnithine racemase
MTASAGNIVSPTEKIIGRKDGKIGHLIFNNPAARNAASPEMWRAIPIILDAFAVDPAIRVVVV